MTGNPFISTIQSTDLQAAIVALIQQNNVELRQLMADVLPTLITVKSKKQRKSIKMSPQCVKARLPYSEMPFWKANPHLKPAKVTGYGLKKEVFEAAQKFFQDPDHPITDAWFEILD